MNEWSHYGGTHIGPYHVRIGQENQDRYLVGEAVDRLVLAVADGAGSLTHSGLGAELALATVVDNLMAADLTGDHEDAVELAVQEARDALLTHEHAAQMGCTLAVALVTRDAYTVGLVGDAFVVTMANDEYRLVANPQGQYANITQLLTSEECSVQLVRGEELDGIALASDGLDTSALSGLKPHEGFWTPVFNWALNGSLNVEELLSHMNASDRLDDDTTLVLARKTP